MALLLAFSAASGCSSRSGTAVDDDPTRVAAPPHQALDEASVNAALAALDAVMGDVQRILVRERTLTGEVTDRLRAIYAGPELGLQLDALARDVRDGLAGYAPVPGNRTTTVTRMISATDTCVFAEVRRDYRAVADRPDAGSATLYVALVPKDPAEDVNHLNPTPWAMLYDGAQPNGSQPPSPCR